VRKKADEKSWENPHIFFPKPTFEARQDVQPTCRQNKKSTKRRQKPRAVISCDSMTTMRDGVLEI
jgi:hypothetical protein